jgi:hypothetical protein
MAGFARVTNQTETAPERGLPSVKRESYRQTHTLENVENTAAEENCIVTADSGPRLRARCKIPALLGALMHDLDYVVELAKAYGRAVITRDEFQDELHSCSIEIIMYGVNTFDEEYGHEAAAFVVAAELPIIWERFFTAAELAADEETSWLPEGCWSIDRGDERVKDFPPE